jgi:hypothetical protein
VIRAGRNLGAAGSKADEPLQHLLQHPLLRVPGCTQGGNDFGDMVGATGFHGDFDGGLTQADAVIGTIVIRLDDIGTMLGQYRCEAIERADLRREVAGVKDQLERFRKQFE